MYVVLAKFNYIHIEYSVTYEFSFLPLFMLSMLKP